MTIIINISECVEWRTEVDVVVIKFGFAMQHRPFSCFTLLAMTGEGIRGMRPISEQNPACRQAGMKCALRIALGKLATGDDSSNAAGIIKIELHAKRNSRTGIEH